MGQLEQTHNLQLNWHSVWILTKPVSSYLQNLCVLAYFYNTSWEGTFNYSLQALWWKTSCFSIFDVMLILLVARASCFCGLSDCGCLRTCMATGWVLVSQPKKKQMMSNEEGKKQHSLLFLSEICKCLLWVTLAHITLCVHPDEW